MRRVAIFLIPFSIYSVYMPLSENGLQMEMSPLNNGNFVDLAASFEIFFKHKLVYFGANIFNGSFNNLNLQNELNTGFFLNSNQSGQWFFGGGVQWIPDLSTRENSLVPLARVLYSSDLIKTYFQLYVNGNYYWGAILYPSEFLLPVEIGTRYEYNGIDHLQLHFSLVPAKNFKTGLFFQFPEEYTGLDLSGIFSDRFMLSLLGATSFTKKPGFQLKVRFLFLFGEKVSKIDPERYSGN